MGESSKSQQGRSELILSLASIAAFWVCALVVWWGSLWHADLFSRTGADLTGSTEAVIWSARTGVPFILAALFSAVVVYRLRRSKHRSIVIVAWLLFIFLLCSTFAVIGMTESMTRLCGELIPDSRSKITSESGDGC